MIIRLGRVLWWLGVFLGLYFSIGGFLNVFFKGDIEVLITVLIIALFCVLVGRGARYILANE